MGSGSIKAVVFDLGNVCIDFDHMVAARRISRFAGMPAAEIFDLLFDSEICRRFEEGRVTAAGFFSDITQTLNLNITYEEFLPIWNEIFFLTDRNSEVQRMAKRLKQDYTLAMISNINILHFEYLKANFPFLRLFDNPVLSFEQHLRKPDERIYKKSLEILNLKAPEVAYTDDRREFTDKANMLGMRSFYYQGPDKLKKDLLSAGINLD